MQLTIVLFGSCPVIVVRVGLRPMRSRRSSWRTTVESRDEAREFLRAELVGVGEHSQTSCGCEWVRLPKGGYSLRGVSISGDVLVRQCEYHDWYSHLSVGQQREVERQRRARERGEECGA